MIFLRHPKPDAPIGMCYGRMDIGIGPEGEAEIARALETTPPVGRASAMRSYSAITPPTGITS